MYLPRQTPEAKNYGKINSVGTKKKINTKCKQRNHKFINYRHSCLKCLQSEVFQMHFYFILDLLSFTAMCSCIAFKASTSCC